MANQLAKSPPREQSAKAPVMPVIPFTRGAIAHTEQFYDASFTLNATQQNLGPIDIPSYGFARAIWIDVQITSTGNSAAVTAGEDAPFSTFAELAVNDINGAPIYGPVSGHDTYLFHKYGGFRAQRDPKLYPNYSAVVTGAGATGGSTRFQVRVNLERSGRDGLGSLANMNASQAYKIRGTLNNLASIYGVTPNGAVTCRIRMSLEAWSQPEGTDASGRPQATVPPANGTTGYFSRQLPQVNAGANTVRHSRVGNYIRNEIYVLRRAGTSRANGELDLANTVWQWYIDSRMMTSKPIENIRQEMSEAYDFTSVAFEGVNGPDNGVFVLPFTTDFSGEAGYEMRDGWLPTTQATRFELVATLANAGVLTILTDDVAPRGNVFVG